MKKTLIILSGCLLMLCSGLSSDAQQPKPKNKGNHYKRDSTGMDKAHRDYKHDSSSASHQHMHGAGHMKGDSARHGGKGMHKKSTK